MKSLIFALKGIVLTLIKDLFPAIMRFFQLLCVLSQEKARAYCQSGAVRSNQASGV